MRAAVWRDFLGAVVEAVRRPKPGRDDALRAERGRGVRRLATEVVARNRRRGGKGSRVA
ncbi:hypothetical protein [Micromonospora sp. NPDC049891]|uniref:hypothetical protein n=1 Tax=Micromonospora sp. NPDC049891 TaxID=3155655 RepID=UPI0033ED1979